MLIVHAHASHAHVTHAYILQGVLCFTNRLVPSSHDFLCQYVCHTHSLEELDKARYLAK